MARGHNSCCGKGPLSVIHLSSIFFHKAKSLNNLFNLFGFLIVIHMKAGDVNYENKEDCDWIIEATPGRNVHLR